MQALQHEKSIQRNMRTRENISTRKYCVQIVASRTLNVHFITYVRGGLISALNVGELLAILF